LSSKCSAHDPVSHKTFSVSERLRVGWLNHAQDSEQKNTVAAITIADMKVSAYRLWRVLGAFATWKAASRLGGRVEDVWAYGEDACCDRIIGDLLTSTSWRLLRQSRRETCPAQVRSREAPVVAQEWRDRR